MAPFFSIVISAYNRGEMLRSALSSIRYQTWTDFECLVVDDGSTDCVPSVLAEFSADGRFKGLVNSVNEGMNAARNRGVALARGRFLTFLDSDDMWLPERLQAFHDRLQEAPEAGFIFSNAFLLRHGRIIGLLFDPRRPIPEGPVPGHFAIGDRHLPYLTTNVAIRREAFERWGAFSAGLKATDTELFARFLSRGLPVAVIRKPLAVRRLHEDQITAGHVENFKQSMAALPSTGASEAERRDLRDSVARGVALDLVKAGRPLEARTFLSETLGACARHSFVWGLTYVPGAALNALRGLRRAFLRLRCHPALLGPEERRVWGLIQPLLDAERGS